MTHDDTHDLEDRLAATIFVIIERWDPGLIGSTLDDGTEINGWRDLTEELQAPFVNCARGVLEHRPQIEAYFKSNPT